MDSIYSNSGFNEYSYGIQFDLDPIRLSNLGFTLDEIQALTFIVSNEGKVTLNKLVQYYGIHYEQAQKLKYMYDICTGRVVISSEDDLCKHLRKMFGKHRRIGIHDLSTSMFGDIPRMALIAGIPKDTPFAIWNSINYPLHERMYSVVSAGSNNITIETTRIPVLKYKQDKFIEGVLKIVSGPDDGMLTVEIDRQYCRLCNRFVIVASLRRPEFHHGMVEIICVEGTRVYVFADTISSKKYSRYGNNTQRVYDYGFYPFEINNKLLNCAEEIYKKLCGVYVSQIPANSEFIILPQEKKEEDEDIQID